MIGKQYLDEGKRQQTQTQRNSNKQGSREPEAWGG